MPAKSKAMRRATSIAEHHPEELYARNRGMLGMSKSQLHDFASTKEKGLPKRKKPRGKGRKPSRTSGSKHGSGAKIRSYKVT